MRTKCWHPDLMRQNWVLPRLILYALHLVSIMDSYYKYSIPSCIWGHHIYKDIWWLVVGERLECIQETRNIKDRYAVVKTTPSDTSLSTSIVGHLLKISHLSSLFIQRGGLISCTVTGKQRHTSDLPQGCLEVPCKVIYRSTDVKELNKIKLLSKFVR